MYQRICKKEKNYYLIVLVWKKCEIPENERKVSKNEVEEFAKSLEASDKTDCKGNVKLAFKIIKEKIIEFKGKPKPKQKSKKCYIL